MKQFFIEITFICNNMAIVSVICIGFVKTKKFVKFNIHKLLKGFET